MKKLRLLFFGVVSLLLLTIMSCNEEENPTADLSTSVILHYSVNDKKVAFNALAINANSYLWDFGDGTTSTEQNPIHIYEVGGYYSISVTVTGSKGEASDDAYLAISLPPFELLTGDPATGNGKTWKMSAAHSNGGDYFANANAELSTVSGTPRPLPDGIFGTEFGMGAIYDDTYTFFPNGSYVHDVKEDGGTFSGYVYQLVTGGNVTNANGAAFGLCIADYTPETDATFTFNENEDLTVPSVYGGVSYTGAMTIDFSGTEFIGFHDFQRKVILNSISDTKMQLTMFMAAGTNPAEIIGVNTNALIMTFEVVN